MPMRSSGRFQRRALDRQAERDAGVDVGEGADLGAAVVPAEAPEQADIVGELLLEVEVEAVLGAALAGLRDGVVGGEADAGVEVGERHGLVVGAGEGAGEPRAQPQHAGPLVGLEAHLQLADVAAAGEQAHVEGVGIGLVADQEVAGAHRPARPVELGREAPGEPQPVGRIVERARCPDRPVEEVEPRILGIVVAVEQVLHGEFADLQRDPRHVLFARQLAVLALDLLALAAQPDLLAQENARGVVARVGEVRLLRFAVGVAAGAHGVGDAEALQQLGIVVELAALPQAHAEEGRHRPGLAALALRREAVGPAVERVERRVALVDEGGLAVDLPGAGAAVVRLLLARRRPRRTCSSGRHGSDAGRTANRSAPAPRRRPSRSIRGWCRDTRPAPTSENRGDSRRRRPARSPAGYCWDWRPRCRW